MEKISEHISLQEATNSATAKRLKIANTPDMEQVRNMKALAAAVFEPLRQGLGSHPIKITSFFRSVKSNTAVGGSSTSQHCKGEAMDLVGLHCSNADIFHYIKDHLAFDQMIWEFGNNENPAWVHVSYSQKHNRRQILKAVKQNGKTVYLPWS